MKRYFNKKIFGLTAAALILTAGASAGKAMAYFTTYAEASGGAVLELGRTTTEPTETVSKWIKHVTIKNTGAYECYVRARAYAGNVYDLKYEGDDGWYDGEDGYWYYRSPLAPNETTTELRIRIGKGDVTEEFNVIVVQEHTAVRYKENGDPYAQWETADSGTPEDEGGSQG